MQISRSVCPYHLERVIKIHEDILVSNACTVTIWVSLVRSIKRLRSANRLSSTELKSEFRLKLTLCDTLARFLWYYGGGMVHKYTMLKYFSIKIHIMAIQTSFRLSKWDFKKTWGLEFEVIELGPFGFDPGFEQPWLRETGNWKQPNCLFFVKPSFFYIAEAYDVLIY